MKSSEVAAYQRPPVSADNPPAAQTDTEAELVFQATGVTAPGMLGGLDSRWRDCHFANTPSPSLLKHLLKVEGGAAK